MPYSEMTFSQLPPAREGDAIGSDDDRLHVLNIPVVLDDGRTLQVVDLSLNADIGPRRPIYPNCHAVGPDLAGAEVRRGPEKAGFVVPKENPGRCPFHGGPEIPVLGGVGFEDDGG